MLDRAAGCFKHCAQRPWYLYKQSNPSHSRRTLCSSFWRHGAWDLELPSWYYSLLQHSLFDPAETFDRSCQSRSQKHLQWAPFLYFLYPCLGVTSPPSRRPGRSSRRGWSLHDKSMSKKHLSSFSLEPAIAPIQSVFSQDPESSNTVAYGEVVEQPLNELLDRSVHDMYRQAWQCYLMIPVEQCSSESTKRLISYLVTSSRTLDAKRALKLLNRLSPADRSPRLYASLITFLLRFNKLGRAVILHAEAAEADRLLESTTTQLLSRLIYFQSWQLILEALKSLVARPHPSLSSYHLPRTVSQSLWTALDRCHNLLSKLRSLLTFVRSSFSLQYLQNEPMLHELILAMMRICLNKGTNPPLSAEMIVPILEDLKAVGLNQSWIYERICRTSLITTEDTAGQNTHLALSVYNLYRAEASFNPSSQLLTNLLRRTIKKPASEVLKVLRADWKMHRGHFSPSFATYLMTAHTRLGHAEIVHDVLGDFCENSPFPVQLPMLQQLMQVHVLRSELVKARSIFEDIANKYKLQPNITCWNILINAYAKADEHDEAIRCFGLLLDAGLKPDMYTFGTVMVSAAVTGQSAFIKELLDVVDDQRIRKSTIMFDSLVKALINEDRLQEAEEVILQAVSTPLLGSKAHMWAQLILGYGLRLDTGNAMRVYALMQQNRVQADATTYAALLRVLAIAKRPDMAFKLLTKAMPAAGISPQPIHYLIVINAYLADLQLSKANDLLQMFESQGFRLTPNVLSSRLRLAAMEDKREFRRQGLHHSGLRLRRMDALFDDLLQDMDPTILTVSEPTLSGKGFRRKDQFAALYFVLAMNFYQSQGSVAAASQLLRKFQKFDNDTSATRDGRVPLAMLRALMNAYHKQRSHRQVMQYWTEAKRNVHDGFVGSGSPASATRIARRRYALARHLDIVMRSLTTMPCGTPKIKILVKAYLADGYALDDMNWNVFVEASVLKDPVFAFRICEENLVKPSFARPDPSTEAEATIGKDGENSLDALRRSMARKMQIRILPRIANRLRRSMRDLRASAIFSPTSKRILEKIQILAPRTVSAIENRPEYFDSHDPGNPGDPGDPGDPGLSATQHA